METNCPTWHEASSLSTFGARAVIDSSLGTGIQIVGRAGGYLRPRPRSLPGLCKLLAEMDREGDKASLVAFPCVCFPRELSRKRKFESDQETVRFV